MAGLGILPAPTQMADDIASEASNVAEDRLGSWKEIAAYLKRGVSTAQRWSRTEGLPIHRLPHAKAGTVFAYRTEIDTWWRERSARLQENAEPAANRTADSASEHITRVSDDSVSGPERRFPMLWGTAVVLPLLLVIGLAFWYRIGRVSVGFDSLAVLPFVNAGGEQDAYLSDGISEHLINTLSQTPNLRVAPRPYTFRYKGHQIDPRQAGRELGVRAVLTGRVLQRDSALNIQVDLIDVEQGSQIWGQQYTQAFADILTLQQKIAAEVSDRLGLVGSDDRPTSLVRRSTTSIEAYEAYLKGRYYWNRRTEEAIRRAVEHFNEALAKDPSYALAASGLADCFAVYSIYQLEPPQQAGPKAMLAATRALALDETMAEPHAALGFVKTHYEWDWAGAEREFQRSIQLNPEYANAYFWYAVHLSATGRTNAAVAATRRAQQLDPLSLVIRAGVGGEPGLYAARRYDEAIEQIKTALELDPGFAVGHLWLALPYEQKKMHAEAVASLEKAAELSGNSPLVLGPLGHAYAVSGSRPKARQILAALEEMSAHRYVSPFDRALVHLGLGDDDRTLHWLDRAFADRSYRMHWLKVDPRFDRLRTNPRFRRLLERMGLAS